MRNRVKWPVVALHPLSTEELAQYDVIDVFDDDFTTDGQQFVEAVDLSHGEECYVVLVREADDYDPELGTSYAYSIPFYGPVRPANLVNLSGENTVQEWPFYVRHSEAVCHACKGPLSDLSPTNNPPGRGNYRGECEKCSLRTWYDCAEGTVELIQQNEWRARQKEAGKLRDARQLVRDLDALIRAGKGDSPEADTIRDGLDDHWKEMKPEHWENVQQLMVELSRARKAES